MRITLDEGGTEERQADVRDINIPDVYALAGRQETERERQAILQVWALAHSMKKALVKIANSESTIVNNQSKMVSPTVAGAPRRPHGD